MHEICLTGLCVTPLRWCRSSAAFWSSGLTAPPSSTPTPHARTSLSPSPFPPRAPMLSPWVRCAHTHTHTHTLSQNHTRQHKWPVDIVTSLFSPQATECQEGHAALHPQGVVESTLSACQPRRPQFIRRALCKHRLLPMPLPFSLPMPLPQAQHLTGSVQDQAAAGGPGRERVCR